MYHYRGEDRNGQTPSAGTVLIQPLLRRLTQAFLHVSIRMVEAMSGYLQGLVASGDLDISLTFSTADTETVTATPIFEKEVMLIGRMVLDEIRATSVEFAPRGHWTVLR